MHGDLTQHLTKNGTGEEKLSHSTQWSLYKEQLQGIPLKKQDILRLYSDVFIRIRKFPGPPYKFQLKPNTKLARHALKACPNPSPRRIPQRNQELGTFRNSRASQRGY